MFETVFFIVAFIMGCLIWICGVNLIRKAILELSRRQYRNCEFTINSDQLEELYDFLKMLQEENRNV